MGGVKNEWLELLDAIQAAGRADAETHAALPDDAELWARARALPAGAALLPEQVDEGLLDELREAFDDGRGPTRVDLDAVVAALAGMGWFAFVHHTGGNTATLFAGRAVGTGDPERDLRWSAMAGSGWFGQPGRRQPVAETDELFVGPDLPDDDAPTVPVPEYATLADVARLVADMAARVERERADADIAHADVDEVARVYGRGLAEASVRSALPTARETSTG